jgi:hypothetical protein
VEPEVPSAPVVEEKDALAIKVKCLAVEVEVEDGLNDEDEGRIAKRLAELALLEQAYIRDDKVLVKEHVKPEVITPESDIRDIIAAQTAAKADAKPAGEAPPEATVEAEATAVTEPVAEFPAVEEAKAAATAGGPIAAQVKEQAGEKPIRFRRVLLNTGQEEFEGADALREEIKQADDIILVIDEVHTLIGAGAAEGAIDAANILKPALARGELQCIGAITLDEYRKHIEKDPALERRFQPVLVPEPTVEETIQILKGLRERYEIHHKLRYTDEALVAAAQLSYQYISDRFLPDKAIDLIDEAGSRVRLRHAHLKKLESLTKSCAALPRKRTKLSVDKTSRRLES